MMRQISSALLLYLIFTLCLLLPYLSMGLKQRAFAADHLLFGESEGMPYQVERVASGLGVPWAMQFINSNQLLFTERQGRLGLLNVNTGLVQYLSGLPEMRVSGQGGLLDLVLSPNFSEDHWLYFTYSGLSSRQGITILARAKLKGDRLDSWQDLLKTHSGESGDRHYGSRIAFDSQGNLYFSVGDRGERSNGQNLLTHAGSIVRLKPSGAIPSDNPFISRSDARPEIWSYGHRNPQGLAYDEDRELLWAIEHGPRGGDEINQVKKGTNYGWPVISYGKEYWAPISVGEGTHKEGMEQPVKVYIPSIAPSSLLLYTGQAFPEWQGDLFAGALALQHLNHIKLNLSGQVLLEERLLQGWNKRIRALSQSPEGWIYLSTDNGDIYRIRPQ